METATQTRVTSSPGFNDNAVDFGIKDPAFIFSLLCDRMYQNPVRTMVQEYMSNARDAHREVQKYDIPIKVTLPSYTDNTLRIRDFGPGISVERMQEVFILLGESTKRDKPADIDDEALDTIQTGEFGVGAKVGWAYADSFVIESIVDNVQRTYLAYMSDEGVGKLLLTETKGVQEGNGVEIQIAIDESDFAAVWRAVQHVSFFWVVQPEIYNTENELEHFNKTEDVHAFVEVPGYNNAVLAVIDGIPYPIDKSSADAVAKFNIPYTTDKSACLFFDSSEIDVAVNREGLRYSDKTIAAIRLVVDLIDDATQLIIDAAATQSLLSDKIAYLAKLNVGLITKRTVAAEIYKDDVLTLGLNTTFTETQLSFLCDSGCIGAYKSTRNKSIKSGVSTKHLKYTRYDRLRLTVKPDATYYVSMAATSPSKAKLRTVLDDNSGFNAVYVIRVEQVAHLEALRDLGFVDLKTIKKTRLSYGGLGYADSHVKSITDKRQTLDMLNLDPARHCYCTFKQVTDVKYSLESCDVSHAGYSVYYATKSQIKYIKSIGVPHVFDIRQRTYAIMSSKYMYRLQQNVTSTKLPDLAHHFNDILGGLRNSADPRFAALYDKAMAVAAINVHRYNDHKLNATARYVGKRTHRLSVHTHRQFEKQRRACNTEVRALRDEYSLLKDIHMYSISKRMLCELRCYIAGKYAGC